MPPFLLSRTALLVSLIIAALLAGVAGLALVNAGDNTGPTRGLPTAGPVPTPSPTPSTTPSPTPTPVPTATATPTATPTVTATPSASPAATAKPTATRTATPKPTTQQTYAYPKPTRSYAPLQLTLRSSRGAGQVGDTFSVTAVATDGDGEIYMDGLDFGDGSKEPAQSSPKHCKSYPPLHSPPGPYQPSPDKKNFGPYNHTYLAPGDYTITMTVASVNATCKPNGPANESRTLHLVVHVTAAAP
ncbi:MAG: hypothetical protein JWN31_629 [Frankiales bacterium]|nr:hypothetical protein [Frankiales bacterium]